MSFLSTLHSAAFGLEENGKGVQRHLVLDSIRRILSAQCSQGLQCVNSLSFLIPREAIQGGVSVA